MLNVVALLTMKHTAHDANANGEHRFWRERGVEYAEKLVRGVHRHLTVPHEITIMTDSPEAFAATYQFISGDAEVHRSHTPGADEFNVLDIRAPHGGVVGAGWWAKLHLFKPDRFVGKTLYLDLDNVVCGNLDALAALEPDPIMMLDDVIHPGMMNGSTMLCYPERLPYLWAEYVHSRHDVEKEFSQWPNASDQAYVASRVRRATTAPIPQMQNLLPENYILNARAELEKGVPYDKTSLVYGSWVPKPHESTHPFYKEHWV